MSQLQGYRDSPHHSTCVLGLNVFFLNGQEIIWVYRLFPHLRPRWGVPVLIIKWNITFKLWMPPGQEECGSNLQQHVCKWNHQLPLAWYWTSRAIASTACSSSSRVNGCCSDLWVHFGNRMSKVEESTVKICQCAPQNGHASRSNLLIHRWKHYRERRWWKHGQSMSQMPQCTLATATIPSKCITWSIICLNPYGWSLGTRKLFRLQYSAKGHNTMDNTVYNEPTRFHLETWCIWCPKLL